MHEAERISLLAYRSVHPDGVLDLPGGATALRVPAAPDVPMLNRIVGLGVPGPATETELDAAIEQLAGLRHYVSLSPHATPAGIGGWLRARGYEPGWGWMQFHRSLDDVPAEPELAVEEIDADRAGVFARIVREAYGLPAATEAVIAATPGSPGWTCWLALADGEPAGAAALFVDGATGYLGYAGTAPDRRGRGAQTALLATRIRRARELGCTAVYTETGELLPDRPSASFRNILRAGFEKLYVVPNWLNPL